ncbi:AraC family transcriptional regulator [Pedobacter cryoconitis]|uniref:AraC-like DNA-binding protein n=1 Tax=Pedobacter cryoconitis TaxID=188932 RepID=A0A327SH36_9SPHI|nr:AraC family transcriptional regulator [Pedobacter cryoconitis]RAJ27264.1 AraC-like DNA-binding protein [Pedobacter cryoconitis]
MKTLIQKIHVEEYNSFACRTYKTPDFETAWHKHLECELILITEGNGTALIGDYIGEYKQGDIFLLNTNVPHWFRRSQNTTIGSAIVIHFMRDFWGEGFLALPEMKDIAGLLESKNTGIQLLQDLSNDIAVLIRQLEFAAGIERIQLLISCMQKISTSAQQKIITTAFDTVSNGEENSVIETIIDYSFKHFLDPISLKEVAGITSMSIPAFCRFFKRNIKKSYFDFIKEIRIGHACKLLRETNRPVLDICYDSGYNSWAHFSKQFKAVIRIPPSQYRKQHIK